MFFVASNVPNNHGILCMEYLISLNASKKVAVLGWAVPADREGLRPLRSARTFGQDGGAPAQTVPALNIGRWDEKANLLSGYHTMVPKEFVGLV